MFYDNALTSNTTTMDRKKQSSRVDFERQKEKRKERKKSNETKLILAKIFNGKQLCKIRHNQRQ